MHTYYVRCKGQVYETYAIDANSEADAMANWFDGELVHSEAFDVGPESAELAEDN